MHKITISITSIILLVILLVSAFFTFTSYFRTQKLTQSLEIRDSLSLQHTLLSNQLSDLGTQTTLIRVNSTDQNVIDKDILTLTAAIEGDLTRITTQLDFYASLVVERMDLRSKLGLTKNPDDNAKLNTILGTAKTAKQLTNKASLPSTSEINSLLSSLQELKQAVLDYNSDLNTLYQQRKNADQFINPLWLKSHSEITAYARSLSDEDLVGQLMISGVNSTSLDVKQSELFNELKPSGIILMGANVISQVQSARLNSQLQSTNKNIPLYISVDQEGGAVKRLSWDTTDGQTQWSTLSDEQLCNLATSRATTLHQAGFNLNYSPVSDLSFPDSSAFINNRTISSDPEIVLNKTKIYVGCHQKNHVYTTLKHFPGHGMVVGDSHKIIPINDTIRFDQWRLSDGIPFATNIDSEFMMVGHLVISQVDSKPASMSSIWLQDVLRRDIGFKGIVITDDMKQFQDISGEDISESSLNALLAGVDQLLYVLPPDQVMTIKQNLVIDMNQRSLRGEFESKVIRVLLSKQNLQ